jgi:adenylosuccinate synthase
MRRGRLNVVIGGQWGSEGKGKACALLARKFNVDMAISNNMSNAGHSFYFGADKYVGFHLPSAIANPDTELVIGPGAGITMSVFNREMADLAIMLPETRLKIHPNAMIIEPKHSEAELLGTKYIASTMKGCGAALGEKVARDPELKLAKDIKELWPYLTDTDKVIRDALDKGKMVMAEVAQGFDLSLNRGLEYPFTTSRDVDVGTTLSYCGVPPKLLGDVYGCLRTYPIRVGNVEGGYSGPFYNDQEELDWDDVTKASGSPMSLEEITTVTGRVRRVFSFSRVQHRKFEKVNAPDFLFLNFVDYIDWSLHNQHHLFPQGVTYDNEKLSQWIINNLPVYGDATVPIAYMGTGADHMHLMDFQIDREDR